MPSTPLPPFPTSREQDSAHAVGAYGTVLLLEEAVLREVASASTASAKKAAEIRLMYCRIVGHFFHHVPSAVGLNNIAQEVISCEMDDQKLLDVGKLYYDHAVRVFLSAKGQTPAQSHHPSRPSFDSLAEMIEARQKEAPTNHQKAKELALVRDGFRCVVTGKYDYFSGEKCLELEQRGQGNFTGTQCAHIIESTISNIPQGSTKGKYAASAFAVLSRFGGHEIQTELNGPLVHRLENVMTLDPFVHMLFDSLHLWLEPTDVENQYKVCARSPSVLRQFPTVVTFATPDSAQLPLPSRKYLELHAACAKVAHLSGAADYFEEVDRDKEDTLVLSEDGSSASVLEHAVWTAFLHQSVSA